MNASTGTPCTGTPCSRRSLLLGGTAALAGAAIPFAGASAQAGGDPLGRLLGQALPGQLQNQIPQQLKGLLPAEAFQAVEFVTALRSLEGEVSRAGLPPSPLSTSTGAIPTDLNFLYQAAMPRLVALVDRTESRNLGLADKAGGLLARLHETQHGVPEWLKRIKLGAGWPETGGLDESRRSLFIRAAFGPDDGTPLDPGSDEALNLPGAAVDLPQLGVALPDLSPDEPAPPVTIKRSLRYGDLAEEYAAMFASAALRDSNQQSAQWHLAMMRQSRGRYEAAGRRTGVPWYFIAAIHGLEASFNFRAHLHNGDFPLGQRTRQVPAGRPLVWLPPSDWESSATDALRLLGFAGASDWSLPRTLYRLEAYNGFGYRRIGRITPYLWSFSSHYERGKFVADGRYDARARSQQCGAAVMLKLLADAGEIALG